MRVGDRHTTPAKRRESSASRAPRLCPQPVGVARSERASGPSAEGGAGRSHPARSTALRDAITLGPADSVELSLRGHVVVLILAPLWQIGRMPPLSTVAVDRIRWAARPGEETRVRTARTARHGQAASTLRAAHERPRRLPGDGSGAWPRPRMRRTGRCARRLRPWRDPRPEPCPARGWGRPARGRRACGPGQCPAADGRARHHVESG
jgi:hypothetical protein